MVSENIWIEMQIIWTINIALIFIRIPLSITHFHLLILNKHNFQTQFTNLQFTIFRSYDFKSVQFYQFPMIKYNCHSVHVSFTVNYHRLKFLNK